MNWEEIKNSLFLRYLYWQGRRARIRRYLRRKRLDIKRGDFYSAAGKASGKAAGKKDQIKAATVQLEARMYSDPLEFAGKMNSLAARAAGEGADLLVLPELNLTQLIGVLPMLADGDQELESMDEVISAAGGDGVEITVYDIFNYIGPFTSHVAKNIFAELAANYQLYIMTGSGFVTDGEDGVFNLSYLFGPDGRLLGQQKKCHHLPFEVEAGIKAGEELNVIKTELGGLAFPICMDATYFESFRIAENRGAEIVMIPIADDPFKNFSRFNYWTAMRGIWGRVQESRVYGIKSALVGSFAWFRFSGLAGFYAPAGLTPDGSGIILEAEDPLQEEMYFAELDLKALRELQAEDERDSNREFWERYFPQIYYYF